MTKNIKKVEPSKKRMGKHHNKFAVFPFIYLIDRRDAGDETSSVTGKITQTGHRFRVIRILLRKVKGVRKAQLIKYFQVFLLHIHRVRKIMKPALP